MNKIHNKEVIIPYLTNPLFMPVKSQVDKLNIDSFPFDIPDIGSRNPIEDENSNSNSTWSSENIMDDLNKIQNKDDEKNIELDDFYTIDRNITRG